MSLFEIREPPEPGPRPPWPPEPAEPGTRPPWEPDEDDSPPEPDEPPEPGPRPKWETRDFLSSVVPSRW
jgi:hypothetical protein